jgi:phosphatidylglycerophosphate synthase
MPTSPPGSEKVTLLNVDAFPSRHTGRRVANALSWLRLALTPGLLALAWLQFRYAYFWTLLFALATDAIDGPIVRRYAAPTAEGARLDSRADLAIIVTVPIGVWLLFPEAIRRHQRLVASVIAAHLLTYAAALVKWRRLPSYHTWGTKVTAVLLGSTVLLLFWIERIEWVFYPAATVAFVSCIDEILITMTLRHWESDVSSWWHARRRLAPGR